MWRRLSEVRTFTFQSAEPMAGFSRYTSPLTHNTSSTCSESIVTASRIIQMYDYDTSLHTEFVIPFALDICQTDPCNSILYCRYLQLGRDFSKLSRWEHKPTEDDKGCAVSFSKSFSQDLDSDLVISGKQLHDIARPLSASIRIDDYLLRLPDVGFAFVVVPPRCGNEGLMFHWCIE